MYCEYRIQIPKTAKSIAGDRRETYVRRGPAGTQDRTSHPFQLRAPRLTVQWVDVATTCSHPSAYNVTNARSQTYGYNAPPNREPNVGNGRPRMYVYSCFHVQLGGAACTPEAAAAYLAGRTVATYIP
ncbi:hypothetical protein M422DRAFT_245875 [Sphaerobolus stellatus SS14]|nr:hypothetical protein M422DRAFT_248034 [Sphaerobolus stellatus SS14]KIJ50073.1 hypothetical protein M422DRAFT_245875 [Sphaerobolus stellatus SS14]